MVAVAKSAGKRNFNGCDDRDAKMSRGNMSTEVSEKRQLMEEEFFQIAEELAPRVGEIIDSYGGVCSYAVISLDETWKEILQECPPHLNVKVKKVVDLFPMHLVALQDGYHCSTALGYENGIVNEDSTVDKLKMRRFWDEKKRLDKEGGRKKMISSTPSSGKDFGYTRLQNACHRISVAGGEPDPKAFNDALREMQNARAEAFGKPAGQSIVEKSGINVKQRVEAFAKFVRRFMVSKGYRANDPMKMSELACNSEAKSLHADIGGTEKMKMTKILQQFPQFFTVSYDDLNKALCLVSLTEEGAEIAQQGYGN